MTHRRLVWLLAVLVCGVVLARGVAAQGLDLREMSGIPLPANDLPAGSVSVRVVRGSFANNLADVEVAFTIVGGATVPQRTDAAGRALVEGLPAGTRLRAAAVVDGERLESQEVTIGTTGIRFVLVAAPGDNAPSPSPVLPAPVAGTVAIGRDSRVIAEFSDDRLNIFYMLQIENAASAPVELGGPIVFEMPQGARGVTVLEDSTPAASVSGPRVTVLGPFAPGMTPVNIAFELPYGGSEADLEQVWPVAAPRMAVFALKTGDLDLDSQQFATKQALVQQGQPIVAASVSPVAAGEALTIRLTGLPHHAAWPRYVALGAAGLILLAGIWAAVFPGAGRRGDG